MTFPPEVFIHIFRIIRGPAPSGPYTSTGFDDQGEAQYSGGNDESLPTLACLSLTCKVINELVTPMLYQNLQIGPWISPETGVRKQRKLLKSLKDRPELGRHVLRLAYTFRSVKVLETLMKICSNIEQFVLSSPPTARCMTHYVMNGVDFDTKEWEKASSLAANCHRLRYLCLVGVPAALKLPVIPALEEVRLISEHASTGSELVEWVPNHLNTLHLHGIFTDLEEEPTLAVRSFRHLHHLHLGSSFTQPHILAELLTQRNNLKTLYVGFDLETSSFLLSLLKSREKEGPSTDDSSKFDRLDIHLGCYLREVPSNEILDQLRNIFFSYCRAHRLNIKLSYGDRRWKSDAKREAFEADLKKMWKMEGREVEIYFQDGFERNRFQGSHW